MTASLNPGAFPTAAGQPSYSGVFIPIIWSSKFIAKFYVTTVFGSIANTDYEGEVKDFGDTVYIPLVPDTVINKFIDGQDLEVHRPEADNIVLPIQRGQYFNSLVTDVQKKQSQIPFLDKWSDDASQKMQIKIDSEILNEVYADAHAANAGATAGLTSESVNLGATGASLILDPLESGTNIGVLDAITRVSQVLDEQNTPQSDRWMVVPPWFGRLIKRSELAGANFSGDSASMLRNGLIGSLDSFGMNVFISNNMQSVDDGGNKVWHVLGGHMSAITFVSQMTNMENIRSPNTFGDLMRGMQVYDFKVIKPESLVDLYCRPA